MILEEKTEKIKSLIREMDSTLVAFSGGVDSTLVLALAHEVMGERTLAVTAQSASVPNREMQASRQLAKEIGARHLVVRTEEMSNPEYRANPANRCYHCKTELYSNLKRVAEKNDIERWGFPSGTNPRWLVYHHEFPTVSRSPQKNFPELNRPKISCFLSDSNKSAFGTLAPRPVLN